MSEEDSHLPASLNLAKEQQQWHREHRSLTKLLALKYLYCADSSCLGPSCLVSVCSSPVPDFHSTATWSLPPLPPRLLFTTSPGSGLICLYSTPSTLWQDMFFSHHAMFNLLFSFQCKQDILFILEREGALVLTGQLQAHWCAHASRPLLSAGPIIQ